MNERSCTLSFPLVWGQIYFYAIHFGLGSVHELGCFFVTTGIDEVLADPAVHMFRGLGCFRMYRILTFAVGFFFLQTGSHSSDRRQYSGFML